jgi:hypothetical protein
MLLSKQLWKCHGSMAAQFIDKPPHTCEYGHHSHGINGIPNTRIDVIPVNIFFFIFRLFFILFPGISTFFSLFFTYSGFFSPSPPNTLF